MSETEKELRELMRQRDLMEREILNLMEELKKQNVGMNEPLVDVEGYPRNDLDIYQVRTLRHQIICKQNDCKMIMKDIENKLHLLHAEEKGKPSSPHQNILPDNAVPFAKVDSVENSSPSFTADLRPGDLIVKFGSLTSQNFIGLSAIANVVTYSVQKPIHVIVKRENEIANLSLTPQTWAGKGLLGCRLVPVNDIS